MRHPLETLKYFEAIIAQVHARTIQGGPKWQRDRSWVSADPTTKIHVTINFEDNGPDSAIWESVIIKQPVGTGMTILGNPASSRAKLYEPVPPGKMIDQVLEEQTGAAIRAAAGPAANKRTIAGFRVCGFKKNQPDSWSHISIHQFLYLR